MSFSNETESYSSRFVVNLCLTLRMKKYRKLIFFLVFILSTVGLVLYRTEYLKLHYAFQLGGLFNIHVQPKNCLVVNDSVLANDLSTNIFTEPSGVWSLIDDFYIYSAFITNTGKLKRAGALGVAKHTVDCFNYKCHVWYSKGGRLFSVNGLLYCAGTKMEESEVVINELFCDVDSDSIKGLPYMFVLIDKNGVKYFTPIFNSNEHFNSTRSAICVFPDISGLEALPMVEFLSFHQLIGITDIIAYDNGIHHGIFNGLKRVLKNIDFLQSFTVLPWNYPFQDISSARELIKKDCLYRTNGNVKLLAFLEWTEYIITIWNHTVISAINEFSNRENFRLTLKKQNCCINLKNKHSNMSWPMVIRRNICSKQPDTEILVNPMFPYDFTNATSPATRLYVNKYDVCESTSYINDTNIVKFAKDLVNSKLIKIWRSGIFN